MHLLIVGSHVELSQSLDLSRCQRHMSSRTDSFRVEIAPSKLHQPVAVSHSTSAHVVLPQAAPAQNLSRTLLPKTPYKRNSGVQDDFFYYFNHEQCQSLYLLRLLPNCRHPIPDTQLSWLPSIDFCISGTQPNIAFPAQLYRSLDFSVKLHLKSMLERPYGQNTASSRLPTNSSVSATRRSRA
jgi:hypothetical protein